MSATDRFMHPRGFDAFYGLELLELSPELARGRLLLRDEHKQPWGIVHGGVYASIAEGLTSYATAKAVIPEGMGAAGMSNQTSFLRPVSDGTIHATAVRKHGGRTTWVWEVEFTDDHGRVCALTRMTIAVRELPAPAP
jgi:1,4-dihydroxy-2-naphthoyl-CoA hydrolase